MASNEIIEYYLKDERLQEALTIIDSGGFPVLKGLAGSAKSVLIASLFKIRSGQHLVIANDKESAAYFFNDLENLLDDSGLDFNKKKVLFYPTSYKRPYEPEDAERSHQLSRTEVLSRLSNTSRKALIVTYPEALAETVVSHTYLNENTLRINRNEALSLDFVADVLLEYGFERTEFVVEPGEFSIRGGLLDVFSFANDHPYRIEFTGNHVESIRSFNPSDQLSFENFQRIDLVPNLQDRRIQENRKLILSYLPSKAFIWVDDLEWALSQIDKETKRAFQVFDQLGEQNNQMNPGQLFADGNKSLLQLRQKKILLFQSSKLLAGESIVGFNCLPQPAFKKNFELLIDDLGKKSAHAYQNYILADNARQVERLYAIFEDLQAEKPETAKVGFKAIHFSLHAGFIDQDRRLCIYTDHQIFERYHKFKLREGFKSKEALSIKDLYDLQPGDFVTHIDHGVGRFDGMQILENDGKMQEVIRLIYKNEDILYVSIHSLHRISKYVGKEGTSPALNKLGSQAWSKLKSKTKKKVKDIARDLIKLYAQRKATKGHAFIPDTYLQTELEASFIYEDTPDQLKATNDFKKDMESEIPMDRLICGDVGFGKTEVAIRAAFKAVSDSKQVVVLVPTTILALQHYKTFSERLKDFPVNIDYLNRFKSARQQKETLSRIENGQLDIIIGTHRLLSKDIKLKDLGLIIVDEEQKFGVAAKERLKQMRAHVDTLTLTATPIPRTLQFSLMGARDLSIINTPPPNRYPVATEIRTFSESVIRDAILYEVNRGGQVFFVHNRVQNILEVYHMIEKFVPGVNIGVAHGQMDGRKLEKTMLDFIDGHSDVLLATTIIESGLDISNANTIIINDAHHFGLSDLHQLRGRVGRSNKKAFCYLLSPPLAALTQEARRRLKSLEEFSDLGGGFNIAMRDLDIRGAGNLLGAEQSGFISEIGFDMYHKILDEAINELKEKEFSGLFEDTADEKSYVKDCQIETDLEVLLPPYYVESLTERLSLYRELDQMEDEKALKEYQVKLIDRFGPLPEEAYDMIQAIRLRWKARKLGFEKIVLKNKQLICYFLSDADSVYFQSEAFGQILEYVKTHPKSCRMKEQQEKLSLVFYDVPSIELALSLLRNIS